MCNQKFFKCAHCGNLIELIVDGNAPITCCGEAMTELIPNTVEAATEKHIPAVTVAGDVVTVQIGSVLHPMLQEHYIEYIFLKTKNGMQRRCLKVGAEPTARFQIVDDTPLEVFCYCNLHGLWSAKLA